MSERRLAAIMFTDIVGYTALMGSDEDHAFEVLKKNREIHSRLIEQFNGTLIKEMGDGMLISFNLASEAVRCAIEIQQGCKEQNIPLKIGIHEGEMVFEGTDVLGDGVNIASRLQEDAPEGCIIISGSVYRDIKNKSTIKTEFLKEKRFKNVDEPIRVYKVRCEKEPGKLEPSSPSGQAKGQQPALSKNKLPYYIIAGLVVIIVVVLIWYNTRERPSLELDKSIAVMPFDNESADKKNIYFVNGMIEDIRNNLSKIDDIRVISKTSTEKYRDTNLSTSQIGKELDVSYLLEGTVQKLGNQVKIHAQLISVDNDDHIWQDTYEKDISDVKKVFKVQSDIAKIIAIELNASITPEEEKRIDHVSTSDITAYDYVLRGDQMLNDYWMTSDLKYLNSSMELYNKALEADPNFPRAIIGQGNVFFAKDHYDSALRCAEKAIEIDPQFPGSYMLKGSYYRWKGQLDNALINFLKAKKLDPNNWWVNIALGNIYILEKGDVINGIPYIQKAYELSTENRADMYLSIGHAYFHIGDFDKAESYYSKALALNVGCIIILNYGWLYHNKREFQEALNFYSSICNKLDCQLLCYLQHFYTHLYLRNFDLALENYNQAINAGRDPSYDLDRITLVYVYKELGRYKESSNILNDIRIKIENLSEEYQSSFSYFLLASIYALQNEKEEAIKYLLKYEEFGYSVWFNEIKIYPPFENLWNEPEFESVVNRVEDDKAILRAKIRQMEERGEISF